MSDELVPVTQADREAAAEWITGSGYQGSYSYGNNHLARIGRIDGHPLVQAFARHRLASRPQVDDATVEEPICLPPDDTDIWLLAHGMLPACPFCNGTPTTFMRRFDRSGIYQAYVHCSHCHAQIFVNERDGEDARDKAIAAWEKRAAISAMPSEREAVVRYLRGQCHDPMLPEFIEFLLAYADALERGEHLQEKG